MVLNLVCGFIKIWAYIVSYFGCYPIPFPVQVSAVMELHVSFGKFGIDLCFFLVDVFLKESKEVFDFISKLIAQAKQKGRLNRISVITSINFNERNWI